MTGILKTVLVIAAGGLILTLIESLLPRTCVRTSAKTAVGLLLLALLASEIAGIIT